MRYVFRLAVIVPFATTPGMAQDREPIIDMHLHAITYTVWSSLGEPEWLPEWARRAGSNDELRNESLAELEQYNIEFAVTSGSFTRDWYAAAPDRIVPARGFGTDCSEEPLGELRDALQQGFYQVVGEVSLQWAGVTPNDPAVEPCFALVEQLGLPVGIHLGPSYPASSRSYRAGAGHPLDLEEVLARHRDLRVYVMHAGWPYLDEMIAVMHNYPRVYADLSLINWLIPRAAFHSYLRGLVDAGLGARLMYGSDHGVWLGTVAASIEAIETAQFLSDQQKRDIFYNNAARFLMLGTDAGESR